MTRVSLVWLLVLVLARTAFAQDAPVSIRGQVVAAENDAALPRARVVVSVNGREIESAFTDDRGRFTLAATSPSFVVAVSKAGYAGERFIASSATRSATSDQIDFALSRAAAVVGRVTDSSGEPAVETRVVAERLDVVPGAQRSAPFRFQADTDDRGEYRIGGLPPGRYTVSPLALMSTPDAASTLTLRAGEEVGAVLFNVPSTPQGRVAPATPLPEGNGVIRGRVRGPSGRALANAAITLFRTGSSTRRSHTDEQGRFAIAGLRAGPYRLEASKTGFVTIEYGQQRATQAGTTIELRDDEATASIDMTLSRGAAVTGTVVDEHGEAIEGVVVRVLQLRYTGGRTLAVRASLIDRMTDDRGRYRLFGLMPGSYLVMALSDEDGSVRAQAHGYAPVYYPATTQVAEASQVQVDVGSDVAGIDLVFTETPVARVSGHALDSSGIPLMGNVFLSSSTGAGAIALEPQQATLGLDGSFTLANVPPGDYVIQAIGVRATMLTPAGVVSVGRQPEFGTQVVSVVGGDPAPVSIRTSPGSVLVGRLSVEGDSDRGLTGLSVIPYRGDVDYGPMFGGAIFGTNLASDGLLRITGLHGPTRFRLTGAPGAWYVKSVVIDGADVTDVPFDFGFTPQTHTDAQVVVSSAGAAIAGHVTSASSTPVTDYSVIVFGTDRGTWFLNSHRVRLATARQDGSFEVTGLPPGEYWVAAVDRIERGGVAGDWQKPEALEQLSFRALRVTLTEGERHMTILRLIRR